MAPFSTKYDIITMGSSTVDAFVHTSASQAEVLEIHHHKDIAYSLGAKILVKDLHFFVGGGGTNTAVAFSRLGLKTAYLGKIGNDNNGKIILDCLKNEHVEFIGTYGDVSGYSVILDSVHDDRTIFTFKGCNDHIRLRDINLKSLDTKWMYFSALMNESFKTQQKVLNYAQKHNIHIAYNPSLYIVNQGMHRLRNILKNTNILIFNKEEAQALLRDSTDNMFNLLYGVLKLGPKIIAITDGHNGVHCYNSYDEYVYSAKPHKVKVMETTGAGDAFGAGFVAGIIMGKDVSFSIKLGMLNAESLISGLGAKTKLLDTRAYAMAEHDHRTIFKKKL